MSWLDQVALRVGQLAGTNGAILCFHGIELEGEVAPSSMHISIQQFQEIVAAARTLAQLVPLQEIVTSHQKGRKTAGLVALTADDAYASWLMAESFLRREDVPFSVFPVTDALARGSTFWWDRLHELSQIADPERWRRFEDDCGLPPDFRRGPHQTEGIIKPLRQWLLAEHAGRWPSALDETLSRLENEFGRCTMQRSMTGEELAGFVERTGAQVGIHTVSHVALPFLSDREILREIGEAFRELQERLPSTVPYLAIPFGLFDARTLRLAAQAGVLASLTLQDQPLDFPFDATVGIPRFCVVRENATGRLMLKTSSVARVLRRFWHGARPLYPVLPSATT